MGVGVGDTGGIVGVAVGVTTGVGVDVGVGVTGGFNAKHAAHSGSGRMGYSRLSPQAFPVYPCSHHYRCHMLLVFRCCLLFICCDETKNLFTASIRI